MKTQEHTVFISILQELGEFGYIFDDLGFMAAFIFYHTTKNLRSCDNLLTDISKFAANGINLLLR